MCPMGSSPPPARALSPILALGAVVTGFLAMALAASAVAEWPLRTVLAIGETVLVIPAVLALLAAGLPWGDAALGRRPTVRGWLLGLACGIPLWVTSLGIMEIQFALWPADPKYLESFRRLHASLKPDGPWDAVLSVAVIALLPAAAEELVCRGVLYASLLRAHGRTIAILGSATIFAAIHADPYRTPFALAVGLVLALVRARTGSIGPAVVAHAIVNALTFLIAPLVDDPLQTEPQSDVRLGLLMALGGALALWIVLRAPHRPADTGSP